MKTLFFTLLLFFIILGFCISCSSMKRNNKLAYVEENIELNRIIETKQNIVGKYLYTDIENIRIKAEKEAYLQAIELKIALIEDSEYKNVLIEMKNDIENKFRNTDIIKLKTLSKTDVPIYPIMDLAKTGEIMLINIKTQEIEKILMELNYKRRSDYYDQNRLVFQEGKLYKTNNETILFKISLNSYEKPWK